MGLSFQIFMGMISVQVYASTVFTETDPTRSELYTVVFAIVQFMGSLVTALTADKFGRRVSIRQNIFCENKLYDCHDLWAVLWLED